MSEESNRNSPQRLRPVMPPSPDVVDPCRVLPGPKAAADSVVLEPPGARAGDCLVFLHGGAFTDGPVDCHWAMLARVCERAGISGVMVDYRLAPENPYPAALEDALAVCRYLRQASPVRRLYLMGDSAGGGLALSAVLALMDAGEVVPEKLVLLSPWLDLTLSNPEIEEIREYDQLLRKEGLMEAGRLYAGGEDPGHYLLSPVNGTFEGLPPTLVLIGTHDILVCDCRRFREKARAAGVSLNYQEWEEMFHDWMTLISRPEARQAIDQVVGFLKHD